MPVEEYIEKLKEKLTGTRLKAPGTILTYVCTARKFLNWADGEEPGESLVNRWFAWRREQEIGERTLRAEFFRLKKLFECNGWDWSFSSREDAPLSEEEPNAPVHTLDEVEAMIRARDRYSKAERFYLAVSTTWGCRREELARLRKRDYNDETILIRTAKHGVRVKHLMPEVLKPFLMAYHPSINQTALSYLYHRIVAKSGVRQEKGMGPHAIRRTLRSVLEWKLAESRLPLSLVADYFGWAKSTKGMVYGGAAMLGIYAHPEIMVAGDPFGVDKLVYSVHPWLKLWENG